MKNAGYIILIILIFIIPPYIRYAVKRILFYIKLKIICRRKGYSVQLRNCLSLFGGMNGKYADLFVRTQSEVFSVKFGGSLSKSIYYNLIDETKYSIRDVRFAFAPGVGKDIPYKEKSKPEYDFHSGIENADFSSDVIPVFIMLPYPKDMTIGPSREALSNGSDAGEFYFYSGSGFLSGLKQL